MVVRMMQWEPVWSLLLSHGTYWLSVQRKGSVLPLSNSFSRQMVRAGLSLGSASAQLVYGVVYYSQQGL